ncbi:hypothetical protein J2I47_19905 [Fibrella sp. HMF5335]|uniref:Curlin associated repeat-containing protein n=1 Tax=Fibrella rubiginis TaxID=2817060 RepID=A0A939K338_9BACT|nr:hypothetical protein [Fibrella rubiginis]MBO0938827.1 hypothetical protein [Fibrella rubiginis]
MKKLFLTGTALMAFAATSFAQNTATLNQNGTGQTSNQNQVGNTLTSVVTQGTSSDSPISKGNAAFTDQRQNHNTTTITQTASQYNQGFVYQNTFSNKTAGGATNEATIQQIGSGSTSGLYPGDPNNTPAANINPAATGNVARIGQEDAGNHAAIEQNGVGNGTNYSNYGRIDQFHGNNGATTSDVYIHQNGKSHGNVASIQERTSGAGKATIEQNGLGASGVSAGNTGTINQSSPVAGVRASIQQNSGAGTATSYTGGSVGNTATINQTGGMGNVTSQQNNGSGDYLVNTITVTQTAGNHTAAVDQNDDSQGNTATVVQEGFGADDAQVHQSGFSGNGTASIHQGTGNTGTSIAFINMKNQAGANSSATINQNVGTGTGGNNTARIHQGLAGNSAAEIAITASYGNQAQIDQHGASNTAQQYQLGTNNQADIMQTGSNNVVKGTALFRDPNYSTQIGQGNSMSVMQLGMGGNTAALYQQGMSNSGTIMQRN